MNTFKVMEGHKDRQNLKAILKDKNVALNAFDCGESLKIFTLLLSIGSLTA